MIGDLVVDVPPESQLHRQVVRKDADAHAIEVDPIVRLHYVEVREPDMADPSGDLERLLEALDRDWELTGLSCDDHVLAGLQRALRTEDWTATVAVHDGATIVGVWPGFRDRVLGVAFDIGSTTVAGQLCDLASGDVLAVSGAMNPQIRFGEDLMSRVSYVMMNPGAEAQLTEVVRACVDELIADLCVQVDADPADVLALTIVGNPIMHHLFLGLDPTELGGAPFALATDGAVHRRATDVDLHRHPGARVYLLPCIAGHVGADTAGVILSEAPYQQEIVNLIVDVGTNAEIVLGNRDRMLAASSPTGPAFEGAQISCGQRAAPGAIERVRIDERTLEPRFTVIGGRPLVRRDRLRRVDGHGRVRLRDHRGDRGDVPGRHPDDRRGDRRRARRPHAPDRSGRPDVLVRGARRRATPGHHAERRPAGPAREGGALRRMPAADGHPRDRHGRPHPAGRRVRRPHRSRPRAGARAGAGLRSRPRDARRQRGGHRRADRAAEPRRPRGDRGASSVGSRRSRPPSSRGSRSTSSARWASRTPPSRTRGWPTRRAACPERGRRDRPTPATPGAAAADHHEREEHHMSDTKPEAPRPADRGPRRPPGRARGVARPTASRTSRARCTPFEVLTEEGLATIEQNADTILEQVGIEFRDAPDALELFKGAGCDVDGERVRFPRGLRAPADPGDRAARFTSTRATPRTTCEIGGMRTVLAPAYGSPFVRDLDGGRRYGTIEDFRNFVKLAYIDAVPAPLGRHGLRAGRPAR